MLALSFLIWFDFLCKTVKLQLLKQTFVLVLVMRFGACLRNFITRGLSTILALENFSTLSSSSNDRLPSFTALCLYSRMQIICVPDEAIYLCWCISYMFIMILGSLLSAGIGGRAKVQAGPIHSLHLHKSHI